MSNVKRIISEEKRDEKSEETREYEEQRCKRDDGGN